LEHVEEERRGIGKTLVVLAVIIIVVLLLLLPPTQDMLKNLFVDPFSPQYPEQVQMTVTRTVTLDANGGHVTKYTIDVPVAEDTTAGSVKLQDVSAPQVSPSYDELWDNGTYDTMVWTGTDLYGTVTVTVTQDVTQTLYQWDLDENNVLGLTDIPNAIRTAYLGDEWNIIVSDPAITSLSEQIVGDETNVYLIARAIYDWMISNVDYPSVIVSGEPKNSTTTLNDRVGDCDDQSMLFCALVRAAGVPAWLQLGAIYDPDSGTMGGHGWVQMYMPTEDGGEYVTIDIVNEDFLVWMPNLFCEYTDNGNASSLKSYYSTISIYYDPAQPKPEYSEGWTVTDYQESEEMVTLDAIVATREEL